MFGLAVVTSALALWGAPTSLPVSCNPDSTAAQHAYGLTWFAPGTTSPLRIEFSQQVCAGLVWLAASPAERAEILTLNPSWSLDTFERVSGLALLVVLHETHHASGDRNEAHTEACAMKALPSFAAQVAPADELPAIVGYAQAYDTAEPAQYHGAMC